MKSIHAITLSRQARSPISVPWRTRDRSAIAGRDYVAAAGVAVFAPGELTKLIEIEVINRSDASIRRFFEVVLERPEGIALSEAVGTCTIIPPSGTPGNP